MSDDMRNLWQAQGPGAAPLTLEELRAKAARFNTRIARRNLREYLAVLFVVAFFSYGAWTAPKLLVRAGDALEAAGAIFLAFELHRRAAASDAPGDLAWQNCADFHRTQLLRQRDALSSVWKWYIGPLTPGLAVILSSGCVDAFRHSARIGMLSLIPVGFVALVFWLVVWVNRKAAASMQRQIDALETGPQD
jgi:hypothetical protein